MGRAVDEFISHRKRAVLLHPAWNEMHLIFLWWIWGRKTRFGAWSRGKMLTSVSAGFRAANSSAKGLQGKADFSFYLFLITPVSWHKDGWKSARCKSPGAPKKASQAGGFAGTAFPSPQIPVFIRKVPFGSQGNTSRWGQW